MADDISQTMLAKILTTSLFALVSILLVGATTYWGLSGEGACILHERGIKGHVSIVMSPAEAIVVIAGDTLREQETKGFWLQIGTHRIKFLAEGFQSKEDSLLIIEGENGPFAFSLDPLPPLPKEVSGPKFAELMVMSNPPGASVYLNSVFKGPTPYSTVDLPPGFYTIELKTPGNSWKKRKNLVAGRNEVSEDFTRQVEIRIAAEDEQGNPRYAEVYVNGHPKLDPVYNTPVKTPDRIVVPPGIHEISVRDAGYQQIGPPIRKQFEQSENIRIRLRRQ